MWETQRKTRGFWITKRLSSREEPWGGDTASKCPSAFSLPASVAQTAWVSEYQNLKNVRMAFERICRVAGLGNGLSCPGPKKYPCIWCKVLRGFGPVKKEVKDERVTEPSETCLYAVGNCHNHRGDATVHMSHQCGHRVALRECTECLELHSLQEG